MEVFFEYLLIELIRNKLGVWVRYLFFKSIGKRKSIEYLSGNDPNMDNDIKSNQLTYNLIIGLITFFGLFFGILYLLYLLGWI